MTVANEPTPIAGVIPPPIPPKSLSMKEIRAAIPKHCFERSLLTSVSHLLLDIVMITALGVGVNWLDTRVTLPHSALRYVYWPVYWWFQGAVMTGVWVLAHECGHQAFSPWKSVNDAFGLVLHSALFVPYHAWRITHSQHHKLTNHTTGDQVFVPWMRDEYNSYHNISDQGNGFRTYASALEEAMEETPIGDLINITKMLLLGWPAYLAVNAAGQKYGKGTNHFNPHARMFSERDYMDIIVSNIGILVAFSVLVTCCVKFGALQVGLYYGIPYLIVNASLVLITYLQHSDPAIVHYAPSSFTFVRGALCTIDRDYGILNWFHHRIGQTHVCHHLFSQMPFYHSVEATEAIRKVLGEHYYRDTTPIFSALRRSFKYCKFLDPREGEVMHYRSYTGGLPKTE